MAKCRFCGKRADQPQEPCDNNNVHGYDNVCEGCGTQSDSLLNFVFLNGCIPEKIGLCPTCNAIYKTNDKNAEKLLHEISKVVQRQGRILKRRSRKLCHSCKNNFEILRFRSRHKIQVVVDTIMTARGCDNPKEVLAKVFVCESCYASLQIDEEHRRSIQMRNDWVV